MIKGIGCDITKIERIEKIMLNTRFAQKVFTPAEQAYISTKTIQSAAGLWTAKEAVSKALGTGIVGFSMRDIEILHDKNAKPYVELHEGAQKRFEELYGKQLHISISHESDTAMAFAIIE